MRQQSCQFLNFDKFRKDFAKIPEDKFPINDMSILMGDSFPFFKKLIEANSTAELDEYKDDVLDSNTKLLDQSLDILHALSNYLGEETILSDPRDLANKMDQYRSKKKRRLL